MLEGESKPIYILMNETVKIIIKYLNSLFFVNLNLLENSLVIIRIIL